MGNGDILKAQLLKQESKKADINNRQFNTEQLSSEIEVKAALLNLFNYTSDFYDLNKKEKIEKEVKLFCITYDLKPHVEMLLRIYIEKDDLYERGFIRFVIVEVFTNHAQDFIEGIIKMAKDKNNVRHLGILFGIIFEAYCKEKMSTNTLKQFLKEAKEIIKNIEEVLKEKGKNIENYEDYIYGLEHAKDVIRFIGDVINLKTRKL